MMNKPLGVSFSLNGDVSGSDRKTICVVGNPRGGTSMVAGVLRIIGIPMGDNIDLDNNEDQDVINLREPITTLINRSSGYKKQLALLAEYLAGQDQKHDIWGWKDPLAYEYLDLLNLPSLCVVVVTRDIVATAMREKFETSLDMLDATRDAALRYQRITGTVPDLGIPSLWISYDKSLRHKHMFLNDLSVFLGIPLSPETIKRSIDFIEPNKGPARI